MTFMQIKKEGKQVERMNELTITKWLNKEDVFFTQNAIMQSG